MQSLSIFLILLASCYVLPTSILLSICALYLIHVLWMNYFYQGKNRKYQRISTWENPAANFLPYGADWNLAKFTFPPDGNNIKKNLMAKLPLSTENKIWGTKMGLREIIPLNHTPDKENYMQYVSETLSSCKSDRLQCLPVPNIAL